MAKKKHKKSKKSKKHKKGAKKHKKAKKGKDKLSKRKDSKRKKKAKVSRPGKRPRDRTEHAEPPMWTASEAVSEHMVDENDTISIGNVKVTPGTTSHLKLKISESYTSQPVHIPISVINGKNPGPKVFITAAIHGDELNGVEVVRRLIYEVDLTQLNGTLVLVPVVNVLGFENSSRYLPDRRDLNRVFPGNPFGSLAERIAHKLYNIAIQCDYGIDLHTASTGRFNLPHIRADMSNPEARRLSKAFGTEVIIDHPGMKRSLRYNATEAGTTTILLEAGECNKFEPRMVSIALRGVMNVLNELGMLQGERVEPDFRVIVKITEWVRVDNGGLMDVHIRPGDLVQEGQRIATVENPFGTERETVKAPFTGMVVGVTTSPLVFPGAPLCHIVKIDKALEKVKLARGEIPAPPPQEDGQAAPRGAGPEKPISPPKEDSKAPPTPDAPTPSNHQEGRHP